MLKVIQKRYQVGDIITIVTTFGNFTGRILAFEENCIVLQTEETEKIISEQAIHGISKSIEKHEKSKPNHLDSQPTETTQSQIQSNEQTSKAGSFLLPRSVSFRREF
ncbi:MAG: hypothetical protein N3A69_04300 [Leptospiraceae bacterium]|nr:hypothetical protein [Leptospiraceae bacterium]